MAIKRKTIENSGMEKEALIHEILSTITGFNLNPIAVIASKTNYLLALGDLTAIEVSGEDTDLPGRLDSHSGSPRQAEGRKSSFTIDTVCGTF